MSARETIAAAIDPDIWQMDLPVPTRDDVVGFHIRRQESVERADAILAALSAAGYAIVPVEPTFRMKSAGRVQANDERLYSDEMAKCVWNAMIAASQEEG